MAESAPAFQFYPRDFLSSAHVRTMDESSRGVYMTLLCVCWIEGSLPTSDSEIVRLGDTSPKVWRRIRERVLACFVEREGRYYNERLDLERQRHAERRAQASAAGRASVERRFNVRSTSVQRKRNPSSSSSSSPSSLTVSSTALVQTPVVPNGDDDGFEDFWLSYPNKTGKGAARKAWKRINPDSLLRVSMMGAVKRQMTWEKWTKDGGQFIPHPSTWLNQQRWLDEAPATLGLGAVDDCSGMAAILEQRRKDREAYRGR